MKRCSIEKCPYGSEPCTWSDEEYQQQKELKGHACPKTDNDPFEDASEDDDFYCIVTGAYDHVNPGIFEKTIKNILASQISKGRNIFILTDTTSHVSTMAKNIAVANRLRCYQFQHKDYLLAMCAYAGMQAHKGMIVFCDPADSQDLFGQKVFEYANRFGIQMRISGIKR